jgi:hypothetical protein
MIQQILYYYMFRRDEGKGWYVVGLKEQGSDHFN